MRNSQNSRTNSFANGLGVVMSPDCGTVYPEVFPWDIISEIELIDAQSLASGSKTPYLQLNHYLYYVAANSWVLRLIDLDPSHEYPYEIVSSITHMGLVHCIDQAVQISSAVINNDLGSIQLGCFGPWMRHFQLFADDDAIYTVLSGLRYLKRFSPLETTALYDSTIDAFLDRNRRNRDYNRNPLLTGDNLDNVRSEVSHILRGYNPSSTYIETRSIDDLPDFSSGVASDCGRATRDKMYSFTEHMNSWYKLLPLTGRRTSELTSKAYTTDHYEFPYFAKVSAVPKTYKSLRIIASEQAFRQVLMAPISKRLDELLQRDGTSIHDQSKNQDLAREGSITGDLATIDLHAASDSLSYALISDIFPSNVFRVMDLLRSQSLVLPSGKTVLSHFFSTMGSRLTFPVETITFKSIVKVGVKRALPFTTYKGSVNTTINAYGDDIIVPSCTYDSVVSLLEECGFDVNEDKSFYTGPYRESCGEEYWNGHNISTNYFPRKPLINDCESLLSIIALQHKLWDSSRVSRFLCGIVSIQQPDITYDRPNGSDYDLWSEYEAITYCNAPHAPLIGSDGLKTIPQLAIGSREVHMHLEKIHGMDLSVNDQLLEQLRYVEFLKEGPRYKDIWSEWAHVSDPSVSIADLCSIPRLVLKSRRD